MRLRQDLLAAFKAIRVDLRRRQSLMGFMTWCGTLNCEITFQGDTEDCSLFCFSKSKQIGTISIISCPHTISCYVLCYL